MPAPSNQTRSGVRTALLSSAAALALLTGAPAAYAASSVPIATNTGNWSGASSSSTATSVTVQVTSSRAYSEWSSFKLDAGNSFIVSGQTGKNWILVNKVTGGTGASISGNIAANGQVWIIDPNGVTVNAGASINVGGLLLSSASWGDADRTNFLAGGTNWSFTGASAPIVMNGTINASGGVVALLGPSVTVGGSVTNGGNSQFLAVAAKDVSLSFDDNGTYFTLDGVTIQKGADGGHVDISSSGSVSADRIVVASAGAISAASIVVGGSLTATQARSDGTDIVLTAADGTGADASPTAQTILSGGAVPSWSAGASQGTVSLNAGGSLSAAGVAVAAGGDVALAGDISATGQATLASSTGAITQTGGTITTPTLSGSAATSVTLTSSANAVGALTDFTAGSGLSFTDGQSLTVSGLSGGTGDVSLAVATGSLTIAGDVSADGAVTFNGPAVLGADTTVTGSLVKFGSTLDGGYNLTITGGAEFDAAVGGLTPLTSLSVSGAAALNGGLVTTTGTQAYTGAVTLGADTTLNASGVSFNSTVDAATVPGSNGGPSVPVDAGLSIFGDASFGGAVGGLAPLTSLSVSQASALNGGSVTTMGAQTYVGAVTFGGDTSLTGSSVSFGSTVDAATVAGSNGGPSVPVDAGLSIYGDASFGGVVGGLAPLTSLSVSQASALNGGSVTTTGAQTYTGAVTLGGDTTLTGSSVTFGSTVDAATITGANEGSGGTVDAGLSIYGDASFGGVVGGLAPLTSLTVNGAAALNGGAVTTTGDQTYADPTTLGADATLTGSSVTFGATLDGAFGLTLAGSTPVTFGGAVGSSTALTSLSAGGAATLNGGSVTTTGTQTYAGAVTLGADTSLTGSIVTVGSTLDGAYALTFTGHTEADIYGTIGGTTALTSMTADGPTRLNASVTTTGDQTYAGPVLLGGPTLTGSTITFKSSVDNGSLAVVGDAVFEQAVGGKGQLDTLTVSGTTLLNGGAITTRRYQSYGGAVTLGKSATLTGTAVQFGSTVDGGYNLTVVGNAEFDGAVGGATALNGLSVHGTAVLDGGSVTTTGAQTYEQSVVLGGDTTLMGSSVDFWATVNAAKLAGSNGGPSVPVDAGLSVYGDATFGGVVGGLAPLSSLTVNGAAVLNGGPVTTTGSQTYSGATTLGADTTLTASSVTFGSTLDGAYGLTLAGSTPVTFGGAVGSSTALTSLSAGGAATLNGGSVTTSGTQTYADAVTLGADTSLTGSVVTLGSTVDGAYALTFAGHTEADIDGTIGGTTALTSLTADGPTRLNASVTTTGDQTYAGPVLLGGPTLTGSTITFKSSVDNGSLAVVGDAVFEQAVGGKGQLDTLTVSGTTLLNGGAITTRRYQSYGGAVTLARSATLTGTAVQFGSSVDGGYNLTVVGNAEFDGAVGGATALNGLSVHGTAVLDGGSVTTTGSQTYEQSVVLGGDTTLTGSSVDFWATVNAAKIAGSNGGASVPVDAGLSIYGDATFGGVVGGLAPLSSLTVNGAAALNGFGITTTGAQTYKGAVTLGSASTLQGSSISFDSTVDGAQVLTVSATKGVAFEGAVGGGTALTSLSVLGAPISLGGSVTTLGPQIWGGALTLTGDATLTSTGSGVSFESTVDGAHALTVSAAGTVGFSDAVGATTPLSSLDVSGAVLSLGGSITTAGDLSLTSAAQLTVGAALTSTGGDISLTSTAVALSLGADVSAAGHTVTLSAAGPINQTAGVITAQTLTGSSGAANVVLTDANAVGTLSNFTASGSLSFTNASGFSATGVNGGASTTLVATTGDLTLSGDITGAAVSLTATNGAITQTGGVLAAALFSGAAGKSVTLDGQNQVDTITGFTAGGDFSLTNAKALSVFGTVTAGLGASGDLALTTTAGDLTLAGNQTATANGKSGGTVTLTSAGAIDQLGGTIAGATLTGSAAKGASLDGANAVGALSNFTANDGLSFTNASGFSATGVNGGTSTSLTASAGDLTLSGDISGDAVSLTASKGAITQTGGVLTTAALSGSAAGAIALDGLNQVDAVAGLTAGGDVSLTNAKALSVTGAVTAGFGASGDLALTTTAGDLTLGASLTATANGTSGGTVTLTSAGAIDQTGGTITAATLTGSAVASATLDQANAVGTLSNFSASGLSFTNVSGFTASGISGGSALSLTSEAGDLTLSGDVSGTTTTLTAAGALDQTGGIIIATTLGGQAGTSATLTDANAVGTLSGFTANAGLSFTNASGFSAAGVDGGASTTLIASSGDLILSGDVGGSAVSLTAAKGAITQTGGVLTTAALSGSAAKAITLNDANRVDAVAGLTAGADLSLTDARALSVTGKVAAGAGGAGNLSLTTTSGALTLGADLTASAIGKSGGTVTLTSAGAIDQTKGVITAATLTGSSAGATSLTDANQITTLGAFTTSGAGADFALTNAQALLVTGPVTAGQGGYGSLTLTTTSGGLTLSGDLTAVADAKGTPGGVVDLVLAGTLVQTTGVITAQTVTGSSVGGATLTGANHFAGFSSFTNTGGGDLDIFDAQDLSVGGIANLGSTSSIRITSTGALTQAGGALASGEDLVLTAGTTLNLTSSQSVVRDYIVTAETFSGQALSPTFAPGRDFTVYALADLTLDRSLTATRNLTLVDAKGAIDASGVTLTATTGNVSVQTGGDLSLGVVSASQGAASLTAGGGLTLTEDIGGATVTLTAEGAIDQTGGVITATTLTGSAGTRASLNDANAVASLSGFTAVSGFAFTNAASFRASDIDGGSSTVLTASTGTLSLVGNISGTATTLTATTGAIDQTGGIITATTLGGGAGTSATLDQANAVGGLSGFTAGTSLSFTNATGFSASGVNGGGSTVLTAATGDLTLSGDVSGTTVQLVASTGGVDQTGGVITAGTLTGSAATSIQLTGANAVSTLAGMTAADGLSFTNASGFSATGVNGGASTSLTASSGQLTLSGDLGGSVVTLSALGGGIDQTGGVITAGTLSGTSVGATSLTDANQIGTLAGFTTYGAGADFTLTNAQSLTVRGPVVAGATASGAAAGTAEGDLTLTTTAGSLTLAGNLTANANAGATAGGAVVLSSAGSINLGAASSTKAARVLFAALSTSSNPTVTGADISINAQDSATLGDLSASRDVAVSSATGSLTINSVSAGDNVVLRAAGDVTVTGALSASGALLGKGAADVLYAADPTTLTGSFDLSGANVDVKAGGAISVGGTTTAATDARFQAGGAVTLADVSAGQDLVVQGASLSAGNLTATKGDVALQALAGDVQIGSASAGNAVVISSTGVTSVSGALTASGSGGSGPGDALAASLLGQSVSTSGDIVIAATNVSLGGAVSALNGDVLLFARPNGASPGDVYVGGTDASDAAGDFRLDAAEIAQISAKSLDVFSGLTAASSRSVQVGAVALPSSLTTLRIYAGGANSRVDVYGPVTGNSASNFVVGYSLLQGTVSQPCIGTACAVAPSAAVLALSKGWTPKVVRVEGTIGGLGAGQAFNQVSLSGDSIYIAPVEQGLDFETATQTTRPEKLAAYQGTMTYQIAASNLQLSASSPGVIYQRNLGVSSSAGRGLTVGALTISTISAGDQGPSQIALFGTLAPKGATLSGLTAALALGFSATDPSAAVRFEPSPAVADQYRFDGCVFGGGACFVNVPPYAIPPITIPDQIGDIADPYAPTDEEPVTSSGGEITWPSVSHGEPPK